MFINCSANLAMECGFCINFVEITTGNHVPVYSSILSVTHFIQIGYKYKSTK